MKALRSLKKPSYLVASLLLTWPILSCIRGAVEPEFPAEALPYAISGEARNGEEVLDAVQWTRTFDLEASRGREIVPVSEWLNTAEIPLYNEATDTLEFRAYGRAASADEEGNLIFEEEGRFNITVTVRDENGSVKIRRNFANFQNVFHGERRARITYLTRERNDPDDAPTITRTYSTAGDEYQLELSQWLDAEEIEAEEIREWLDTHAPESLDLRAQPRNRAVLGDDGTLTYRDEGEFRILVRKPGGSPLEAVSVLIENSTEGERSTFRTHYEPKPLDISEHVLVVYNRSSPESEALKDYYIRERPGFGEANVLGVTCTSDELTLENDYLDDIESPIVDWLLESEKNIRYLVLLIDIPTRVHARAGSEAGSSRLRIGDSVSNRLASAFRNRGIRDGQLYFQASQYIAPTHLGKPFSLAEFQGMTALVTHLNMGDPEASKAYIDKIKSFENTGGILHPATDSYAGNYYMEDHRAHNRLPSNFFGLRYLERMKEGFARFDDMRITYRPKGSDFITSGDNVAFFGTLGRWGGRGADYATDGQIQWGANADWWLMLSVESFNGQRVPGERQGGEADVFYGPMNQGNFIDWFSAGAFGGSDYSRTPVGAVSHVEEPTTGGINDWSYLAMWHDGFTFAECAWLSRRTGRFMATGDPLVARKPPDPREAARTE